MQHATHARRMSKSTAMAILLAVVGMLAIGGAWSSAVAAAGGNGNGNGNGNGANQSGPYDPTPDCQGQNQGNSQNCNGDQSGPSDDKNPPGQVNNTHDRGYECDDNKGVGDHGGNPAHTGCATTTTTSTTIHHSNCTSEPCSTCVDTNTCPSGCTTCGGSTVTPNTPNSNAEVLGLTEEAPPGATTAAPAAAVEGTELPRTGSTAETLGFVAIALLAFGGSATLIARREEQLGVLA